MDQRLTLTQSAKDMAFTKASIGVKELSKATEAILEAQNAILDMTRVMINESMRRVQVLSDPDRHSAEESGEAGKECLEINSWMLSAANQQACITMSKITELLGSKARGQDDGPKENVLNRSQVMNAVTTDVDKLAQQRKLTKQRPQSRQPGVSGWSTTHPSVLQSQGNPKANDSDAKIHALNNQVKQLKEANLGLRTSRGPPGASTTDATGNRAAGAGENTKVLAENHHLQKNRRGRGKAAVEPGPVDASTRPQSFGMGFSPHPGGSNVSRSPRRFASS